MDDDYRRVFILRHGEMIENVFGKNWIDNAFNEKGEYEQFDINLPRSMPKFKNKHKLRFDSPITMVGQFQAFVLGEKMAKKAIDIRHVVCSPTLACLQTCIAFLKGYCKPDMPVSIEPGYSDILLNTDAMPQVLTNYEIKELGLNVRFDYQPTYPREIIHAIETFHQYFNRQIHCVKRNINETKTGNVLLITHLLALAVNLPNIFKIKEPKLEEYEKMYTSTSFGCLIELKEKEKRLNSNNIILEKEYKIKEENDDDFFKNWENIDTNEFDMKYSKGIYYDKEMFPKVFNEYYDKLELT